MKNKIFIRWINENFPNPKDFNKILGITEEETLEFFNNLKPKLKKKIPKITSEDKMKNNIDIVFNEQFINLSD
jgi:hypothetical protein